MKLELRESMQVVLLAVVMAATWGIYEASFLFMVEYHGHAFVRPASGVSLFVAGLVSYGTLGLLFGLLAGVMRLLLGIVLRGRRIHRASYILVVLVSFLGAARAAVSIKRSFLEGIDRHHPLMLLAILVVLSISAAIGVPLYLLLSRIERRIVEKLRATSLSWRRVAVLAVIPPAAFLVVGVIAGAAGRSTSRSDREAPSTRTVASDRPAVRSTVRRLEPPTGGETESRPNVVLITLETTRADHLNSLGYEERITSPNLDRLAADGALFTRAYSQAPWTKPAMASLFASLYPTQHGMVRRGTGLGDEVVTLPDVLRSAGYRAATFYTNNFSSSQTFGFDEYFGKFPPRDRYYVSPVSPSPFLLKRIQHTLVQLVLRISFPADAKWYADGERVNWSVMEWLADAPTDPFLLHVHYLDPHDPYFDHPFRTIQFDPRTERNREKLVERYDGEIRNVDRAIGELIGALEEGGHLEDAIIVVTSDHGEEFLDHGDWGHRHHVYSELLHVPLIVVRPGAVPAGLRLDQRVSTIDIAPTILELAGLPVPESFEGRSVLPIARGEEDDREVLSQLTATLGEKHAFFAEDWKLIKTTGRGAGRLELYDLTTDPEEQDDVVADHPEIAADLESRLDELLGRLLLTATAGESQSLSEEQLEQLRALGYVD